jgi:threonine/homoserine/homoserine lactone efflux protein
MGSAIGQILPFAIGVAISPIPIVALILMLFSASAKRNSIAFALGWILGLALVGAIVLAFGLDSNGSGESDTSATIKLVLGLMLLVAAVRQFRSRPHDGEDPKVPAWMDAIDSFTPNKAFGVGMLLSAVNPKNLALTVGAAATISSAGLDSTDEYITLAVYVLIASVTIIAPVAFYLILGERADRPLSEAKTWLLRNNNTVMFVLLLVFGFKLIGDGLAVLL